MTTEKTTVKLFISYSGSAFDGGWTSDAAINVDDERPSLSRGWHHDDPITVDVSDHGSEALCSLAEACGICGDLTECQLIIYGLRKYAACRDWLRDNCYIAGTAADTEWTPYEVEQLDAGSPEDYAALADAVAAVFGEEAGAEQRDALRAFGHGG